MKNKHIMEITTSTINNSEIGRTAADPFRKQKKKLKDQINNLRTLISQAEHCLDIIKFGAIVNTHEYVQNSIEHCIPNGKVPDVFAQISHDLYKYAGFQCVKLTKDQYVFNFTSSMESGSCKTFSVQICNKDGKASVGKWVMPMSSDINEILLQTPITNLASVIPFLRNCKHHVDCFTKRLSQFNELEDHIIDMSRIKIDANIGYTIITLCLFQVHNKTKDLRFNLTIHLHYKPDEARPSVVNTEWSLDKSLSTAEERGIKSYTKYLKNHNLKEGFKRMMEIEHPIFTWHSQEFDDDALEPDSISESSDSEPASDEGKSRRRKKMPKRRKDQVVGNSGGKRKKRKVVADEKKRNRVNENQFESSEDSDESLSESLAHQRNTTEISAEASHENPSTSRSKKKLPSKTVKRVLRQTTLSFQKNRSRKDSEEETETNSNINEKKPTQLQETKFKNVKQGKLVAATSNPSSEKIEEKFAKKFNHPVGILATAKTRFSKGHSAMTSTPLHRVTKSRVKFLPVNDAELSPIGPGSDGNS